LISRRNLRRAGTRFNVRGIDKSGNVANNVESEQIVITDNGHVTSLVQTRGSIPVFWKQPASMKYTPRIHLITDPQFNTGSFRRHFAEQLELYGNQVVINLLNQKGDELKLSTAYHQQILLFPENDQKIKYFSFDFHRQLHGMKYERLSILLDQIKSEISNHMFFSANAKGEVLSRQQGVFRTNCLDNLDRTNVVQTLIARESLAMQLRTTGISLPEEKVSDFPNLDSVFKNIWANNADILSLQYSGTGALKNDFTRTGKRNSRGLFNDGINSLTRFYLNNFSDGFRQDSLDLFLGNFVVDSSSISPFGARKNTLPKVILLILAMMLASVLFTPEGAQMSHQVALVSFWLMALFVGWTVINRYGSELVDKPRFITQQ